MTINQLLHKYKQEKACMAIGGDRNAVISTLKALECAIEQGAPTCMHGNEEVQWQIELKEVDDVATAMLAFYEMSLRNFNKRATAKLAFLYATKLLMSNQYPQDTMISAFCIRSIVIFKNIEDFLDYARWAKEDYYQGALDNRQFFDILLLANVYCGWMNTLESDLFDRIKRQAPQVAANHTSFSKVEIIRHGLEASEAVYKFIIHALQNSSFPVTPSGCC